MDRNILYDLYIIQKKGCLTIAKELHTYEQKVAQELKMYGLWKPRAEIRKFRAKGISLKPEGYSVITMGENKKRHLHDVLMEEHIGRKLKRNEIVHHRNLNPEDDEFNNLQLMTRSEHMKLHRALQK